MSLMRLFYFNLQNRSKKEVAEWIFHMKQKLEFGGFSLDLVVTIIPPAMLLCSPVLYQFFPMANVQTKSHNHYIWHIYISSLFCLQVCVFAVQLSDNRDGFSLIDDTAVSRPNKFNESADDFESHSIGNLLPDEEELLTGMMDDLDLSELPDADDYDLFGSGGGMELDTDFRDNLSMSGPPRLSFSSLGGNAIPQFNIQNGAGTVAGEHPYGEHPSRTLFVRNINSNVEDSELKTLFEVTSTKNEHTLLACYNKITLQTLMGYDFCDMRQQYGDIRTLYTTCKHRGFVMISYYDIRSARMAMRSLQNKPLRRRKLDIHFSIPKVCYWFFLNTVNGSCCSSNLFLLCLFPV